jgi:hypothetical protein
MALGGTPLAYPPTPFANRPAVASQVVPPALASQLEDLDAETAALSGRSLPPDTLPPAPQASDTLPPAAEASDTLPPAAEASDTLPPETSALVDARAPRVPPAPPLPTFETLTIPAVTDEVLASHGAPAPMPFAGAPHAPERPKTRPPGEGHDDPLPFQRAASPDRAATPAPPRVVPAYASTPLHVPASGSQPTTIAPPALVAAPPALHVVDPPTPAMVAPPPRVVAEAPSPIATSPALVPRELALPTYARQEASAIGPIIAPPTIDDAIAGASGSAPPEKRIQGKTLREVGAIRAALWSAPERRRAVLRAHGLSELRWKLVERAWADELESELARPDRVGEMVGLLRVAGQQAVLPGPTAVS